MNKELYRFIQDSTALAELGAHGRCAALYDYWRSLAPGPGLLPGRQHFDPVAIPALLPGIWLLDVHRAPEFRLKYRLVGSSVVQALTMNPTGQWFDEANRMARDNPAYFARYRETAERRLPTWRRGRPQIYHDRDWTELENLFTPFARDGETVDLLVCLTVLYRRDGTVW